MSKAYKIGSFIFTLIILVLPTITFAAETSVTSVMRRTDAACYETGNCELNNVLQIAVSLYTDVFKIYLVPATLLFVVIAGLRFVLSQGDAEKIKGARNMLTAAIIGLLIALASFLIIDFLLKQSGIVTTINTWSSSPQ